MKYKFFFLLLFAFIPESFSQDEDCDFKCRYEKLSGKEIQRSDEKKPYKPSLKQSSFAKAEPLIYKKEEVQRWLDEITREKLWYDGDPLWDEDIDIRFKLGNVRGDVDSFVISDFKVSLNYDEIFSIDEISMRDSDKQGMLNARFSLDDLMELSDRMRDYRYNGEFKILGIRPSPKALSEIKEEILNDPDPTFGIIFGTGAFENISIAVEMQQDYRNFTYSDIVSLNNKVKAQQEFSFQAPSNEQMYKYWKALEKFYQSELFSECETNFDNYKDDYELGEDFPYSVFVSEFFVCMMANADDAAYYYPYNKIVNELIYDLDLASLDTISEGYIAFNFAWSKDMWDAASLASGGAIDAGIFAAKTFLTNKMSKYELVALLDGAGIPYEYKGLFDEVAYEYYSNFFNEAKTFVNYPRGLGFKIEITDKIDPQVFMQVEDNPMLLFNILNKIEIDIYANPQIKNL